MYNLIAFVLLSFTMTYVCQLSANGMFVVIIFLLLHYDELIARGIRMISFSKRNIIIRNVFLSKKKKNHFFDRCWQYKSVYVETNGKDANVDSNSKTIIGGSLHNFHAFVRTNVRRNSDIIRLICRIEFRS